MDQGQAIFNESNIVRTVAVDALANRCIQLAADKAALQAQLAEYAEKFEALKKEVEALKAAKE